MIRRVQVAAILLVTVAACGGDPASPGVSGESTLGETTPPTTEVMVPHEWPLSEDLGLASIALLTPASGLGERPDLAWEAVAGAASYRVTVLAPDGAFYWAWTGVDTLVPLGGSPRLSDAATGPRLVSGMTWTVVAFDAESRPLAVGGPATLSR